MYGLNPLNSSPLNKFYQQLPLNNVLNKTRLFPCTSFQYPKLTIAKYEELPYFTDLDPIKN